MATVTCPQCGTLNPAGAKFCSSCGISLTQRLNVTSQPLPSAGGPTTPAPASPAGAGASPVASPTGGHLGSGPLRPGMTLQGGRYLIEKALGGGGMGSVYLARDTRISNKPVVVKEMLGSFATQAERQEAEDEFRAEAATMAALNYPTIPSITDFFTEAGRHFLVQDFIEGEDLQKKLDAAGGKPLAEKQVLPWMSQVLGALDYMANQNPQVIHRDVKPANIIVDTNNRARLVDFGVASHRFKPGSTGALRNALQQSTPLGTPGYAPPEQFAGNETVLSDLYALGATMHHLLTGRDPRQFVDPKELWVYPPPRSLNPALSEGAARIMTRATQKEPAKRYPGAATMKRDVDLLVSPPGALSTLRGRAIALLVLLIGLVAVAGASLLYAHQQALLPATGFLSDGAIAFDTDLHGRAGTATDPKAWAGLKAQASVSWKNGNRDQASTIYAQATSNDQTDAESWIYQANYTAETGPTPPYVIAVGGSFSGADVFSGREILQGAYTAQKAINDAGGINGHPLVLLLANDASGDAGALQSARKVAARADVLAMVGYRTSQRTGVALPVLAQAHISLVTPTASNPNLNTTPYFFRVCPNDTFQAAQAVRYMLDNLVPAGTFNAHVAVFSDPNDRYSNVLGGIVGDAARSLGARIIGETYTGGVTRDFSAQARDLVAQQAKVIYFAGYAPEALRLAQALDAINAPADLQIMAPQEFYNPAEFIAQPGHKARFHFTSFFYPDEDGRAIIPPAPTLIAAMKTRYATIFHRASLPLGRYGSDRVAAGTALTYDAVQTVAAALRNAGSQPTRESVQAALAAIGNSAPAYQGVTGPISFDQNGDPRNKTVLILHLDAQGRTRMDGFLMDGWLGQYG